MVGRLILLAGIIFANNVSVTASANSSGSRFEISFPASVQQQPMTGRMLLLISRNNEPDLRLQFGLGFVPIFGVDVDQLKPRQLAVVDAETLGYPRPQSENSPAWRLLR
jgi:hypothetical protein